MTDSALITAYNYLLVPLYRKDGNQPIKSETQISVPP